MKSVAAPNPVRLSLDRIWLYGVPCALITSLPYVICGWFGAVAYRYDFACFWSAGANVGTSTLTNPALLYQWAKLHQMTAQPFSYPPAFAYAYAPLSHLSPLNALAIEQIAMTAIFIAAGLVGSRLYGVNPWFGVAAVLFWAPSVAAIETGQNIGIALFLIFFTGWALVNHRPAFAGAALGILLYKPTIAIPLLLLTVVRREWRVLQSAAAVAVVWYVACIAASGGDWLWFRTYLGTMAWWLRLDFAAGSSKAFTIPTLLMAAGANVQWATVAGIAVLALSLAALKRVRVVEAVSMAPLIGLAASVHSWSYEAALMLPAVFFAATTLREPQRTALFASSYVAVALALPLKHGSLVLAAFCIGGAGAWIWAAYHARFGSPAGRLSGDMV